jgi:hypothetical protein
MKRNASRNATGAKVVGHGILASAGIDYLTATSRSTSTQVQLRGIGHDEISRASHEGNRVTPWAANGYRGHRCGHRIRKRGNVGTILRLSGGRSAALGPELCRSDANITRLDLQATVRFNRDVSALARHHASEARRDQQGGAKQRHLRIERTFGRGDTLYVGSRVSNYYGRVYDKHRESGDEQYRRCWRYEVECKGDGARQARKAVNATTDVPAASAALVCHWFRSRGCAVRYRPELADELAPVGASHSDLDTWLTWLLRGVRPVVQRCLLYVPRETIEHILFAPGVIESEQDGRVNSDRLLPPIEE